MGDLEARKKERRGRLRRDGVCSTSSVCRPHRGTFTVLVVKHAGRHGSLRFKAHDSNVAEVRFGDGSHYLVDLRFVCWATEQWGMNDTDSKRTSPWHTVNHLCPLHRR